MEGKCGSGWTTWVVPDLMFRAACAEHDKKYDQIVINALDRYVKYLSALGYEKAREVAILQAYEEWKLADLNFYKHMIQIVEDSKYCRFKKWLFRKIAKIYYNAVKEYGWEVIISQLSHI